MKKEKYEPTPEEVLEAHDSMTGEQKEMSAARQIFLESEHRIVELPQDLEYSFDEGRWPNYWKEYKVSGTFDGHKISLRSDRRGKISGFKKNEDSSEQELSEEEAKQLWEKIFPVVYSLNKMTQAEEKMVKKFKDDKKREETEEDMRLKSGIEQARAEEREKSLKEGEELGEIKGPLNKRLREMECSDEDKVFLENIINEVGKLMLNPNELGIVDVASSAEKSSEKYTEYRKKVDLIFELFQVDKDRAQKWVAGFGVEYLHSRVYKTFLPNLIIRESYDRAEVGSWDGAVLRIEQNSKFQEK